MFIVRKKNFLGIKLQTSSNQQNETNKLQNTKENNEKSDVENSNCFGKWSYPKNCQNLRNSFKNICDYQLTWKYDSEMDIIEFELEAALPKNWWTGVGFSSTGQMLDADMIVIRSQEDGNITLMDMHAHEFGN